MCESRPRKFLAKIILLGESESGKTNLISKFVLNRFMNQYRPTIGADFLCKELEIQGQKVTLQLWDTAGQERFQSLGIAFYRGSDVFVFVFSKGNRNSFNKVESFLEDFMSKVDTQPIMYLVGNKVDLESESVISLEEGSEKAMKLGMRYIETSALSGYQIDLLFQMIGTDVIERAIN